MTALTRDFFARSVHEVARELLGCSLLVDGVGGPIVEVEAYDADDPASHGYRGLTTRNRAMFGPAGHAYVYRSYGIHWCLNLVCSEEGRPEAALIRALEPRSGLELMRERRGGVADRLLCAGPGRLCQALASPAGRRGPPLDSPPFEIGRGAEVEIAQGPRVGVSRAASRPWRYAVAGSGYISRTI